MLLAAARVHGRTTSEQEDDEHCRDGAASRTGDTGRAGAAVDEKPAVRIDWDYGLILEWASHDERHDIDRALPADLRERIRAWERGMEDAYGRLHEDDPPPVDPQAAARLEAELTGIQERLRELGYGVEGNGRWWIAAAGVTVRDVDSGRFPDHPSRLIRTTASGDIFAVLVPAGTDVQPPGSNPLAWVRTAPGEAGILDFLAHRTIGRTRWDVAVVLVGGNAFMHVVTRVRYPDREWAEGAFVGCDDAQMRWWLRWAQA